MISDEVFVKELDGYLKAQGFNKKRRQQIIDIQLREIRPALRDKYLEKERIEADRFKKKPVIPSEDTEQIKSVEWFKKTFPGVDILSIRNEGSRTPAEKAKQLCMGLLPGASDLLIPDWHLYIEMKRVKGGVLSKEQREFGERRCNASDYYMVCRGFEQFQEGINSFYEWNVKKQ